MLIYWAGLSRTGLKVEMRRWIDLTNEAQHGGSRKVCLEYAEEKSSVDRPDLVCSFHNNYYYSYSRKKRFTCITCDMQQLRC